MRYPGDLAMEMLSPKRSFRNIYWLAPLAAAAVVAVVLWTRHDSPVSTIERSSPVQVAVVPEKSEADSLFAVKGVPSMQSDYGLSPSTETEDASFPSFTEVSAPEMPTMPSFSFSYSDAS